MRYEEHKVFNDVHNSTITQVAFSPEGKLLASAGLDGTLCIWEVDSGELRYQYFTGHDVLSLVWADPSVVVCGLNDGTISCLTINFEKKTLDVSGMWGHAYPVEALAVVKSRLASGAHKELFIWRWNNNMAMSYQERDLSLAAPSDMDDEAGLEVLITGVDWSGNNGDRQPGLLVISYMNHGIRIFETQAWAEVRKINTHGLIAAASVSPDGAYIAVSNILSGVDVYALDDGGLVSSFHQDVTEALPVPVVWVHGGHAILAGTTVGKVRVWYFNTSRKRFSLTPSGGKVLAISAYYNVVSDEFFIACGADSAQEKSSIFIWKAGDEDRSKATDHEPAALSDNDEVEDSSSDPETQIRTSRSRVYARNGGLAVYWNRYFWVTAAILGMFAMLWIVTNDTVYMHGEHRL